MVAVAYGYTSYAPSVRSSNAARHVDDSRHRPELVRDSVADFDRAVRFYETILEAPMRVGDFGGENIAVFPYDETGVGGSLVTGMPSPTGTLVYLNANGRLDRALELVDAAGGRIVAPKFELPNGRGFSAQILDSEGNRVGLHANS